MVTAVLVVLVLVVQSASCKICRPLLKRHK
jgi:hypothetical protein